MFNGQHLNWELTGFFSVESLLIPLLVSYMLPHIMYQQILLYMFSGIVTGLDLLLN